MKSGLVKTERLVLVGRSLVVAGILLAGAGCVSPDQPKVSDDVAALKTQVWALQKQVAKLSLEVSQNSNDVALLQSVRREGRLKSKGKETAPSARRKRAPAVESVLPPDKLHGEILEAFERKDYQAAVAHAERMLGAYPRHRLAEEAQYLSGLAYLASGDPRQAAEEFRHGLRDWPTGKRAPEARLKLAESLIAAGDRTEGETEARRVIEEYPESDAAGKAQAMLDGQ